MGPLYEKILGILRQHVSDIHARGLLRRAVQLEGVDEHSLGPRHLPGLLKQLDRSVALFVTEDARVALRSAFAELQGAGESTKPVTIVIRTELDLTSARTRAREISQSMGGNRMQVQRVATVVSELARNILLYTPGGQIEIVPKSAPSRVHIRASDEGDGIPNLDQVMSGSYRSKTGMGMGLLGSKRLADNFDIRTGASGTVVEAEVRL